jgi:hypothetical protein
MSEMTPEKADLLRATFPAEAVGKLPKPLKKDAAKGRCEDCGGWHGLPAVHLDYVGHAAVTDRLLKVDPGWSWEPFATGPDGLPLISRDGLWIRLTICGVTRPGFGDGNSVKEMIGDAIRNAAMRFGVALDLWAKENLVEFAQQRVNAVADLQGRPTTPALAPGVSVVPAPQEVARQIAEDVGLPLEPPMTAKTRGQMFALFGQKGVAEDQQLAGINAITGQGYTSRADLTEADAKRVIAALKKRPDVKAEVTA